MTTVVFFGFFLSAMVLGVLLWAGLLFIAARVLGKRNVRFRRTVAISVAVSLAGVILQLLTLSLPENSRPFVVSAVALVLMIPATWLVIHYLLGLNWWKSVLAGLSTLLAPLIVFVLVKFVVVPYAFEAYKIAANSMAPTLLGEHIAARCPDCGAFAYASPEELRSMGYSANRRGLAICEKELTAKNVAEYNPKVLPADRVFVNKFLIPRRWDLIVFRVPGELQSVYVKRLVGLPGETITIKDSGVWANGARLALPPELHGLEYVTDVGMPGGFLIWGSEENPAVLGKDEFFVLGDFSLRSKDSRLWEEGAPGHPSYAVPKDFIIGVATHIYWPVDRWRVLR
jgi:signal peptidase I